jgi:hypothetical protein
VVVELSGHQPMSFMELEEGGSAGAGKRRPGRPSAPQRSVMAKLIAQGPQTISHVGQEDHRGN